MVHLACDDHHCYILAALEFVDVCCPAVTEPETVSCLEWMLKVQRSCFLLERIPVVLNSIHFSTVKFHF